MASAYFNVRKQMQDISSEKTNQAATRAQYGLGPQDQPPAPPPWTSPVAGAAAASGTTPGAPPASDGLGSFKSGPGGSIGAYQPQQGAMAAAIAARPYGAPPPGSGGMFGKNQYQDGTPQYYDEESRLAGIFAMQLPPGSPYLTQLDTYASQMRSQADQARKGSETISITENGHTYSEPVADYDREHNVSANTKATIAAAGTRQQSTQQHQDVMQRRSFAHSDMARQQNYQHGMEMAQWHYRHPAVVALYNQLGKTAYAGYRAAQQAILSDQKSVATAATEMRNANGKAASSGNPAPFPDIDKMPTYLQKGLDDIQKDPKNLNKWTKAVDKDLSGGNITPEEASYLKSAFNGYAHDYQMLNSAQSAMDKAQQPLQQYAPNDGGSDDSENPPPPESFDDQP